ncbi:Hypothetical protein A7982_04852 [Minicystis rosea]|nr:Hypothetical protein A7982_04852 [Minicystis rosea]
MIPARSPIHLHARRSAGLLAALASLSAGGCYFTDQGLPPPEKAFYYPTGLAVSKGRSALYVANSDFDLQFNGGTVQVVDLRETRKTLRSLLDGIRCVQGAGDACDAIGSTGATPLIDDVCNAIPFRSGSGGLANGTACSQRAECVSGACVESQCAACKTNDDCLGGHCNTSTGVCMLAANTNTTLTPSACTPTAPSYAANGSTFATIGAFASGAVLAKNPDGEGTRLFVPVRGDPSITWFDVADDVEGFTGDVSKLECGQSGDERRCDQEFRMGTNPYDNLRALRLPVEPVSLDVSEDGTVLVSAHQISGSPAIGLSVNDWARRPNFEYSLNVNVPAGPSEVARIPMSAFVKQQMKAMKEENKPFAYQLGFVVTYSGAAQVDIVQYNPDTMGAPPKPFITRAAIGGVATNADGKDSRGVAIDSTKRDACEATCTTLADPSACQRDCMDIPLDMFIANRAPASLLIARIRTLPVASADGTLTGAFDKPEIYGVTPLPIGVSKVALGEVIDQSGKRSRRIFTVSFDPRYIYSYDPELGTVDAVIYTGRGPHALAFDTGDDGDGLHSYLYVGHFTDSYLGVVDLDMRHSTFGTMFASIGTPTPPRESK